MPESICPECGKRHFSTHPLCVSCREPVRGQKRRTWGKVEWKESFEDVDSGILITYDAYYGPSNFARIVRYGNQIQPYVRDYKTKEFVEVAIPYSSLGDLKRQLETFKEM